MVIRKRFEQFSLPGLKCSPGRVKQAFKDECDINAIMARYNRTGILPQSRIGALYGDVSALTSYQDGLDLVARIDDAFAALPSAVRARFGNSPENLLDFLGDKRNLDEAVRLGLVTLKDVPSDVSDGGKDKKDEQQVVDDSTR